MKNSFNKLEKLLKRECHGAPVYYLSNPGNWGDGLIRHGTLKFFNDIHLDFTEVSIKDLRQLQTTKIYRSWRHPFGKKATVIYGGGGAWCKLWNHSIKYINELQNRYNIIVLPSTYESSYTAANTLFFARDKFESLHNMPQAFFCHDMAFYIGSDFTSNIKGQGTGYYFRTDKESTGKIIIPENNQDISLKGNHLSEVSSFFEAIDQFESIHTDRLHVCIAGALLGKKVHLYPGSYFKNRALYLSTLEEYFNTVTFHEDPSWFNKSQEMLK